MRRVPLFITLDVLGKGTQVEVLEVRRERDYKNPCNESEFKTEIASSLSNFYGVENHWVRKFKM